MKKIIVLFLFTLFTFHQTGALAHSTLESSNPEKGSTVTEKLDEIQLTFNTEVEESSTFKVLKDRKTEVPVEQVQINGSTLTGQLPEQLENGSYTVSWDIVGADGHVIKDSLEFTLNVPAPVQEEQPPAEDKKKEPAAEKKEETAAKEKTASETPSNDSTMVIIGSILAIAAVAAIFFSLRKGRR
ncbi:copper resistance protein CopC [Metabacillus sp. KIGAM252]|uniref:Copper resistance protein CopC n=1 Tax=Metabacillus flavus TaxID=2823519 RepID=A0ABS5LAL5_9BACI|nr:copper resistance CopC family protein [Metabacillus flavus]MBS2967765.1 copper resistance protein CopC [Metabacillus flavus]